MKCCVINALTLNIDRFKSAAVRVSLKVPAELAHNIDLELLRCNVVDSESLQSIAEELGLC